MDKVSASVISNIHMYLISCLFLLSFLLTSEGSVTFKLEFLSYIYRVEILIFMKKGDFFSPQKNLDMGVLRS